MAVYAQCSTMISGKVKQDKERKDELKITLQILISNQQTFRYIVKKIFLNVWVNCTSTFTKSYAWNFATFNNEDLKKYFLG